MSNHIRRQRMAAARAKGTHTPAEWIALKNEFQCRCVRCGDGTMRLDKDHIVPVYKGGSDSIDNIQPLCARCNASKGPETTDWAAFRRIHGWGM